MRFRLLFLLMISVVTVVVAGCGGGGGDSDTTGTLSVASSATSVAAGKTITVTATYTHPTSTLLNGLAIKFTDQSGVFQSKTAYTNQDGVATAQLTASNTIVSDKQTTIIASTGGLNDAVDITVKADQLTITLPTDGEKDVPAASAGSVVRFVPSGDFVTFLDGNGDPIVGADATITVETIVNKGPLDDVLFWHDYPVNNTAAPGPVTEQTDVAGKILHDLYTVDVQAPAPGDMHVITVVFKVVIGNFVRYANVQYTVTTKAT